eukprot:COSAG01_NODE_11413_length_1940_cov_1.449756_1_plen_131_part_00
MLFACTQGELNLTTSAYVEVVSQVMGWGLPLLILGGGGYHNADSARAYAAIAAEVAGVRGGLPRDVPEHDQLHHYGPSFRLATERSNARACADPSDDGVCAGILTPESGGAASESVVGGGRSEEVASGGS